MAETYFRHGSPLMIDYTPGAGAIDAGDIVLIGNTAGLTCGVAHNDIANSTLGALAAGGGVYKAQIAGNYAAGTLVYKPAGNAILTTTTTNNAPFGFTVETGTTNTWVNVAHVPHVTA